MTEFFIAELSRLPSACIYSRIHVQRIEWLFLSIRIYKHKTYHSLLSLHDSIYAIRRTQYIAAIVVSPPSRCVVIAPPGVSFDTWVWGRVYHRDSHQTVLLCTRTSRRTLVTSRRIGDHDNHVRVQILFERCEYISRERERERKKNSDRIFPIRKRPILSEIKVS